MIKHIVFFNIADDALGVSKAENAARMKQELEALADVVPTLRHIEVGVDFDRGDGAWDVALYSEFDSREDLAAYQSHPAHVKVAQFISQVRTGRAVVDYEI